MLDKFIGKKVRDLHEFTLDEVTFILKLSNRLQQVEYTIEKLNEGYILIFKKFGQTVTLKIEHE